MGIQGWPVYGEDLGSTIEDIEIIVAKIKTNKFDNEDLVNLVSANNELLKAVLRNVEKD